MFFFMIFNIFEFRVPTRITLDLIYLFVNLQTEENNKQFKKTGV